MSLDSSVRLDDRVRCSVGIDLPGLLSRGYRGLFLGVQASGG
jgi:hypothetical protein